MVGSLTARWLLTAVFAAAGLGPVPTRRGRVGTARAADRVSDVFHVLISTALIAMTWRSEAAVAVWSPATSCDPGYGRPQGQEEPPR